jgi:hypothetical protein
MDDRNDCQRLLFVDVLKLFAIFCVIWGHTPGISHKGILANYATMFAYSFHMPLFYFPAVLVGAIRPLETQLNL